MYHTCKHHGYIYNLMITLKVPNFRDIIAITGDWSAISNNFSPEVATRPLQNDNAKVFLMQIRHHFILIYMKDQWQT